MRASKPIGPACNLWTSMRLIRGGLTWMPSPDRTTFAQSPPNPLRAGAPGIIFFKISTQQSIQRNLSAIAGLRDELPLQVLQIDDGFQTAHRRLVQLQARFSGWYGATGGGDRGAKASSRGSGWRRIFWIALHGWQMSIPSGSCAGGLTCP